MTIGACDLTLNSAVVKNLMQWWCAIIWLLERVIFGFMWPFWCTLSWGFLASLLTINLLQPLWFFSVHYLLHFADVVSFITTFGSMLWLLVSLPPAQFGIIPDFFEGFFHLFQTLHWYHLHDSAKEQVFVGLFWLVDGWIMKLVYSQWVSGWVWNHANEILLEIEVRNHANRFSQMKD